MKRKLLSIVLALCLTLTLLPTMSVAAGSYADTNGHWAETAIERWSSYGILQGSEGKFAPDGTLTRAQMATILSRLLNLPAAESVGFTDVPAGEWYADAINRCAAAGILQGTDGKANPNAPITREQAMVMLCRALGIEALSGADLSGYPDGAQVSPYAQGYVAALVRTGIVKGDVNGKLNSAGVITRAEIVTIVDRMVTVYANADGAAVSAANGGTVLVVAKNVKVENAPEGTKIIAGKDASGLSVNGKAVSAGQTYIVPAAAETKPSTSGNVIEVPPHAHVYTYVDNGNGKHTATCYAGDVTFTEEHSIVGNQCTLCGATQTVDSAASVKKSDGTYAYYQTLAEAIRAADAGDTITLVEKSSENFVVPSGKDITLDLNGYKITTSEQPKIEEGGSLTIRGEGGSIILEKAGIYLEGSLTLESGKIESKEHSDVIFIMGNGNFTMTGGMLLADAGACIDASYVTNGVSRLNITGGVVETKDPTVNAIYINNRFGSGKIELTISGGTIKAAKQAAIAQDASDSVSTISLTGGTFSSNPSAYVAEGYIAYQKDDGTYQVVKNAVTVATAAELQAKLTTLTSAGSEDNVINITSNIDLKAGETWTPVTVDGYNGAGVITINGNGYTIKGLNAPLIAGGFAGKSGVIIKNLTLENVTVNDSANGQGIGAFIGCVDSMQSITLDNCHLKHSTITSTGGARVGGLIGWTSGYNNPNDGPVNTHISITNCSVESCSITAKGSVGAIIGHAGANPATYHTITGCTVKDCVLRSTDDGGWRVGVVVGTANVGEVTISGTTVQNSTVEQTGKTAPEGQSNLYGRFVPGETGKLTIDGIEIKK